jgi:hypothetical protein
VHPAGCDVEVDVVERHDLAERLADAARADGKRLPSARVELLLDSETRQFVSELGM